MTAQQRRPAMAGKPLSIRIPERLRAAIGEIARRSQQDLSAVVNEMLEEAVRMRRIRGIVFADEFEHREAKVAGTGLGVWEIVEAYQRMGEDWERYRSDYDWLGEDQLRAALAYWRSYPEEINEMSREKESWTQ